MTFFRKHSGCKNKDDIKVLLVGLICTVIVFVTVNVFDQNVYSGVEGTTAILVDLVPHR